MLTARFRANGSTRFGKNNRFGYFPSMSVGWNIAKEDFMETIKGIKLLKLCANWGQNGNDRIGDWQYLSTVSTRFRGYTFNNIIFSGASPTKFEVVGEQIVDCCYGGGNSNDVPAIVRMSRWEMDPNDRIYDALWYKYYAGIFRANLFLQKIEGIAFLNQDDKNRMIAEAHFLRAYFYFDLVRLFENIPLILHPLERSEYYTQTQAAPSLTYAQLKKDLVVAIKQGLPDLRDILASETARVSKHAAEALLARVWL